MRVVGLGIGWDELKAGDRFRTINRTITEADLVNFINATGMVEMIFTDATFSDRHGAIKGGRPVPGALVYCFCEGLLVQGTMQMTGLAMLETTMKMTGPTNVGDTIYCDVEVQMVRETSKGGRGIVKTLNRAINQKGETVLEYEVARMVASSVQRDASV